MLVVGSDTFAGEIPKELGDLPALETLGLGDNRLSGKSHATAEVPPFFFFMLRVSGYFIRF